MNRASAVDEPAWLDEREDRAWRGWLLMHDLLGSQIARDLLQECGVSDADYMVLVQLSESTDGEIRMTDMASRLRWSKSRLSHQVGRMEARGLVARTGCPTDARGSMAVLTTAGRREIERAAPWHVASVRRHLIDLLAPEQLDALATIAETVVGHLVEINGGSVVCPTEAARTTAGDLGR